MLLKEIEGATPLLLEGALEFVYPWVLGYGKSPWGLGAHQHEDLCQGLSRSVNPCWVSRGYTSYTSWMSLKLWQRV
jgi:hypothetical protein